ncbi:MAG: ImmA/IrrE family metallo-endopeptidase [Bacteroidota bacterium]|nr:ImmA/IrrE family metallo-endopeptidase [Bacteroidota bacterium]MDX5431342.1 ImmA/IrrE family metallo-endopeptidase [Bacteroidota bacterium]
MKTGRVQNSTNDYLSVNVKNELSQLAEGISNTYCPDGLVNPEVIAQRKGITYNYGNYENAFDGLIEHLAGRFHIYINVDRLTHAYTERARFTFAHELGHYFIDHHRNALKSGLSPSHSSFTGFVSKNYAEREADYFASCLLLPETRFKTDILRRKFKFEILQELSKKYQTSFTATALRFATIGNHPIMVVLCYKGAIKWYWYSDDFPYKSLRHGKSKVPEDTVAGEYFSKNEAPDNKQEVFAIDWFNYVYDSDVNRKFYEQCMFYKGYCLSVLWEN